MRNYRILVPFLIVLWVISCKTTSVTTPTSYSEDLSALRPKLEEKKEMNGIPTTEVTKTNNVRISGHLREEMDSVNRMIANRNAEKKYIDGFTIQIYTGTSREEAYRARDIANRMDEGLRPFVSYDQPSYKVKVGSYIDKLEAHRIYEMLKKELPLSLLIPERIRIDL